NSRSCRARRACRRRTSPRSSDFPFGTEQPGAPERGPFFSRVRQVEGDFREDASMAITREQVAHVARLARLALTEEELERFREQLGAILEAVGKVAELDLADVPPTSHPLDLVNVFGEDEPHASLTLEGALANAPDPEGGFFAVPARGG